MASHDLVNIISGNGRHQAITWINADSLGKYCGSYPMETSHEMHKIYNCDNSLKIHD